MAHTEAGVSIVYSSGVQIIRFNNPETKNAIQVKAYKVIKDALEGAAADPSIKLTVLTGTGNFYSSGFDFSDLTKYSEDHENTLKSLQSMIDAFIDYPKLLIALVNGPAIGLALTTLGLCDIVYASNQAFFSAPFSKLGVSVEGCASYTFPIILGTSKANEVLLAGHVMNAKEANMFNLVSVIYPHLESNKVWNLIFSFTKLSTNSIVVSKSIMKKFNKEKLHEVNKIEIEHLKSCFKSEDFTASMLKFISKKSKL